MQTAHRLSCRLEKVITTCINSEMVGLTHLQEPVSENQLQLWARLTLFLDLVL